MCLEFAGKGVEGRLIKMPAGCPDVKFSMVNSGTGGGGDGLLVHNPEKPVYNVFIGVGTGVIDNKQIRNSNSFRKSKLIYKGVDQRPTVFKIMQPTKEAVKRVGGCVHATVLDCLDNYRD